MLLRRVITLVDQLDPLVSEELYISIYIYTTETEVPESIGQAITVNKHVLLVW